MPIQRYLVKTVADDADRLRLAPCPEPGCGLPTEVYDQADLTSTDGPIPHVRIRCLDRHGFFMPLERLRPYKT